jgi:hypothetical protein
MKKISFQTTDLSRISFFNSPETSSIPTEGSVRSGNSAIHESEKQKKKSEKKKKKKSEKKMKR